MVEYYVLKKLATSEDASFQTGDKFEFVGSIDIYSDKMNSEFIDKVVKKFGKDCYLTFSRDNAFYFKFYSNANHLQNIVG